MSTPVVPRTADTLTTGQLAVVTLGRLALNVAYRIIYPLQPFLAQRLHVDLYTVSALITVQVLASVASPLGGALADLRGERSTMSLGLALFCCGAALCSVASVFGGFLAGYALIGLAVALYQPSAQSYLSARTSYGRRGRVLGVFETSWAAAALLGVAPLMWLVQATGDSAWSFRVMLVAGLCSLVLMRLGLPPAAQHPPGRTRQRLNWGIVRSPSVLGVLGLLFCTALGVDLVFVVQGAWSKASFGATEAQLGQVFAMLGVAELVGSLGSTLLVDRVGKKRAVLAGYSLTALSAALLPLSDGRWLLFLPLYFLFDLCYEFSIVSTFPLASGVVPAARGTMMALSVLMTGSGRATGSQVAAPLWHTFGIGATGLLSASVVLVGVVLCWLLVREGEHT